MPEIDVAIKRGKAAATQPILAAVTERALDGDNKATEIWLRAYRPDIDKNAASDLNLQVGGDLSLTLNLVQPSMTPEQFLDAAAIEGETVPGHLLPRKAKPQPQTPLFRRREQDITDVDCD